MGAISLKYKSKSGNLTAPGDVDPGAMIPLATVTVGAGGSSSVTFSDIPGNYEHLQIRCIFQRTTAATFSSASIIFNSDTTNTNYARHDLYGTGAATGASGIATGSNTSKIIAYMGSGTAFGPGIVDILDYTNTNKYKVVKALGGVDNNGSGLVALSSGMWLSTAAITSINMTFDSGATASQYSSFALYGIKRAGA